MWIPTVLSANSGHLDLMRLGCPGVLPISSTNPLKFPLSDSENFRVWVSLTGMLVEDFSRLPRKSSAVAIFTVARCNPGRVLEIQFEKLFSALESVDHS